ncbi:MAG: hypothetical protein H7Z74_11800 [Anaerolineae bacterium]|nr:hypothetical protein [Gemmatimonadaceae bacterium]
MSELPSRSADLPAATHYYRRDVSARELMPAIGAGVFAGIAAFYVTRLFLQKTPLIRESGIAQLDDRGVIIRRPYRSIPGE